MQNMIQLWEFPSEDSFKMKLGFPAVSDDSVHIIMILDRVTYIIDRDGIHPVPDDLSKSILRMIPNGINLYTLMKHAINGKSDTIGSVIPKMSEGILVSYDVHLWNDIQTKEDLSKFGLLYN